MFLLPELLYVTNSLQSFKVGPIGGGDQVKSKNIGVGGCVAGNSRGEESLGMGGTGLVLTMDSIISMVEEGMS